MIRKFFRKPALTPHAINTLAYSVHSSLGLCIVGIQTEFCYNIQLRTPLEPEQELRLSWLLRETFEPNHFGEKSFLENQTNVIEIGPRLNFETPFSSAAVEICRKCGVDPVVRLERSRRYQIQLTDSTQLQGENRDKLIAFLHDRMTEQHYDEPLETLDHKIRPEPVRIVHILEGGMDILQRENKRLGLGMDEQDLVLCMHHFGDVLKRNPTDVELMQIAQANSEHCRHWFFKGRLIVDGTEEPKSLMDIVKTPWERSPGNSLIAFDDDSSAIRVPWNMLSVSSATPGSVAPFTTAIRGLHPTLTAETHNMPSGIAPYPGAATGTGGRIRDNLSVGRAGIMGVAAAGYCVGNLEIPGFEQPWEMGSWTHPNELASPLEILIRASDGASDYGNCIGEPVLYGFTRTSGLMVGEEWRAWNKPIMYTAGAGQIDEQHLEKGFPQKGMYLAQLGGPAYRIGLGGGAASSMVQGENSSELDFNAVQRGNPEMEQRVARVVHTCSELGSKNPIISIHDLGAGGHCSALPELAVPAGARIEVRNIPVGDTSLSVAEIWANESQEREAILVDVEGLKILQAICDREGAPMAVVGEVTGDGLLVLHDESDGTSPVSLPLGLILENLPRKVFQLSRVHTELQPLQLPVDLTVMDALMRVLRLPAVASKRFLTTKVDRCVTGLVAQQQCVGPMHVPVSDFAIMAQSHFELRGVALSIGEQPMKGLISPAAMARLAVTEALLNMVGVGITKMSDIRCSANWMWAAKLDGEGARLLEAAHALSDILCMLGIAIDGGKDSLSMAAKMKAPDGTGKVVKAPGELVIANYAPVPDITHKVTPDVPAGSILLFIDLGEGKNRLGGSALAQVYGQVGNESPDLESAAMLIATFEAVQSLLPLGILTAVHDRSDGGLITTVLEMAFAGGTGLDISLQHDGDIMPLIFNEEPGLVLACTSEDLDEVLASFKLRGITPQVIGRSTQGLEVRVSCNGTEVLSSDTLTLRGLWEETSTELEMLQADPAHARTEHNVLTTRVYKPLYAVTAFPKLQTTSTKRPRIAILREQGSNSDREMAAAFLKADCDPHDITMNDLLAGQISLEEFQGLAFVGGFSFGDVLDAGKGWAGVIRFNPKIAEEFAKFYNRLDTFSFGVCNGCQLMALLNWVPGSEYGLTDEQQPRFIQNASAGDSRQFESRFSTVEILPSPAIMLKDMAGSRLGVWVSHGEGRLHVPYPQTMSRIVSEGLAPVRFAYPEGGIANGKVESYPFNPNGSPEGIAALCSPNGRHLAIMPHPERTAELWNWPWLPDNFAETFVTSPWMRMFHNAREWCNSV